MESIEISEIQAFLTREFKEMSSSRYYLLQVSDPSLAKQFLSVVTDNLTSITTPEKDSHLNIGFTKTGLQALGLNEKNLGTFSREFREGMVTDHRTRLLGDTESSAPHKWLWGGPNNDRIDLILMIFGKDDATAENYYINLKNKFSPGFKEVYLLNGNPLPNDREHFGFKDGISQPAIEGIGKTEIENDNIKTGEFVMGYKNEYNIYPDTPLLEEEQGDTHLLKMDAEYNKKKDLGRNGTYFVLRQLEEDVKGFWSFLNEKTKNKDGSLNPDESTFIAAKMMGRWPSGAPLVKFDKKDPGGNSDDNDFNYIKEDQHGLKCPFGAHIRRANPRDHFEESPPGTSLKLTRRHRIMRRVRSYGENFIGSATNYNPNREVGLLFGCFNADISRQFEFIQYTWANYPKFKQLYADPDPFIGVKESPAKGEEQNFTIPTETSNKVITGLQRFVHVKGGAYFFFPSVSVVKFLSTI